MLVWLVRVANDLVGVPDALALQFHQLRQDGLYGFHAHVLGREVWLLRELAHVVVELPQ
jgi:hypothetical protein